MTSENIIYLFTYYKYLYLCTEIFIPVRVTIFVRGMLMREQLEQIDEGIRGPRINCCCGDRGGTEKGDSYNYSNLKHTLIN